MCNNSTVLNKCPCGCAPSHLTIEEGASCKYSYASGACCNEWSVEFRSTYTSDSEKLMGLAIEAWNRAPRET